MSTELSDIEGYFSQTPALDFGLPGIPYEELGQFAFDILSKIFGIPDPLDLILGAFSGRPTMEATIDLAKNLKSYSAPPLQVMAIGAADLVNRNIPISSPAADPVYGQYFAAAVYLEDAIRWSNLDGSVSPVDAATLKQAQYEAANPGVAGVGTLIGVQNAWESKQNDGTVIGALTTIAQWGYTDPARLIAKGVAERIVAQKTPPTTPTTTTKPTTPTTTTKPTTPTTTIPQTLPNPDSDEFTDWSQQFGDWMQCICTAIQALAPQNQTQPGVDMCCQLVVNVLSLIQSGLHNIRIELANVSKPIDFAPLIKAIECICDAAKNLAATGSADAGKIADAISNLATAAAPGVDLKPIVEALNKANELRDIPHSLIQPMFDNGVLPPEMGQVLQATPADWVHAALGYGAMVSPPIAYAEYLLGDDADLKAAQRKVRETVKNASASALKTVKALAGVDSADSTSNLAAVLKNLLSSEDKLLFPLIKPLIDAITSLLKTSSGPCPPIGNIGIDGADAVSASAGVALTAGAAAWLAAFAGIDEGEPLAHLAELIAGLVGFEELRDVEIGPLIHHGIERQANLRALRMFRQQIIGAPAAYGLAARGIITRAKADELAGWNGLACELEQPLATGAQTGLNPRMMIRLIETGLFQQTEIEDELTFNGLRPVSQARMLRAAPYLATQPQRNELQAAIRKAYAAGLLSDQDVLDQYDSSEHNVDRGQLVLAALHLEVQIETAKALETEYALLFESGLIDQNTYNADLAGIPLQPWKATNIEAVNEIRASARLARQEAAAARALAKATAAEERRVAIRNYLQGNIDAAGLAAALVLTGLTAVQAAAFVDMAVLHKTGSPRWLYGKRLDPSSAALLRERIAALTDQFKRQQISQESYQDQLKGFGIGANYINALVAAAASMISPKKSAYALPVENN